MNPIPTDSLDRAKYWFTEWTVNGHHYAKRYRDSLEQLMWGALLKWAIGE